MHDSDRGPGAVFDPWFTAWASADVWTVSYAPAGLWQERRRQRLHALVAQARDGSAWWRDRLRGVPARAATTAALLAGVPVLAKRDLMANFDDAVTDRSVRRADAQAYARSHDGRGGAYLGRYLAWESSGSRGEPGLFLQDSGSLAVGDAIAALRGPAAAPGPAAVDRRIALVGAIDGPFASILSLQRLRALNPWVAAATRAFSLLQPLHELVAQLQAWRPQVLATYPSMAWVLAQQQRRGALDLRLDAVWTGGETLSAGWRSAIAEAFGCGLRDSYGASECLEIANECASGSLHLNADWVILEPVDEHFAPVPPGQAGATTLLTNLANRVQPILRYDIGDRVRLLPGRCACGSPLPVIEVQGRADDVVRLQDAQGRPLHVSPLALTTVLEDEAGVCDFRLEQRGDGSLWLALFDDACGSAARRRQVCAVLRGWLRGQGAVRPSIRLCPPSARATRGASGKLARVVVARPRPLAPHA
jgi:phenylacetate-coenzyme A ligase PaaK-like adenylate-forming protein